MSKSRQITINGAIIGVFQKDDGDYISLTDMAKYENDDTRALDRIKNWLRNKNTIEFLGLWEELSNNNAFKGVEFDTFRMEAGSNAFTLTPKQWVEKTKAVGIISKSGRYGGTYAHKDIAFKFASWISPAFELYLIKELQRLKEIESNEHNLEWNVRRLLSKTNYKLQSESVKEYIIPKTILPRDMHRVEYANEAEVLNMALFGYTSKHWREKNPERASKGENMREIASINELNVLTTIESLNADMIKRGKSREERLNILRKFAQDQLSTLNRISDDKKSIRKIRDSIYIEQKKQSDIEE